MPNLYRVEKNSRNSLENTREYVKEYREEKKASLPPKKKKSFKIYRKNTMKSLNEVEHFLRDFNHFCKYVKLYKILK